MADFDVIAAGKRFNAFAKALFGSQKEKDEAWRPLAIAWGVQADGFHQELDQAISHISQLTNEANRRYLRAEQLQLIQADWDARPSAVRRIRFRDFREALMELLDGQRVLYYAVVALIDDYLVPNGFDPQVVRLFNTRRDAVFGGVNQTCTMIGPVTRELKAMDEQPGQNPRKIPYQQEPVDRTIRSERIAAGLRDPPLELQNTPSLIPPGDWQPAYFLGGGMSQAALWVDVNEYGVITNRVVRKDTHIEPKSWSDATRWYGDMRPGSLNSAPMEYHCQRILQERPETMYAVPALKCEVDIVRSLYRLYLPYCPHGDLGGLIFSYQGIHGSRMPEPFLWRVLGALIETGLIMERGGLSEVPANWLEIVHRDLKPGNVFLDLNDDLFYPNYPRPKLADFGLAIQTYPTDPLNLVVYNHGAGTPGYYPPEQRSFVDEDTRERVDAFKLLAHTNVWGIGAIMYSLANLVQLGRSNQLHFLPSDNAPNNAPAFNYPYVTANSSHLSKKIRDTIRDCMEFDPANRPTFEQLAETIDEFITTRRRDGGVGQNLFQAREGVDPKDPRYDLLGIDDPVYKLGFAFKGPEWAGGLSSGTFPEVEAMEALPGPCKDSAAGNKGPQSPRGHEVDELAGRLARSSKLAG